MNHIWTVFCRDVLEDKTSDVPSLIGVTERIGFQGNLPEERPFDLPFPMPFHIVSYWWRQTLDEPQSYMVRVRFIAPDETELQSNKYSVEFEDANTFRSIGRIGSLPYYGNGVYKFEVSYKKNNRWTRVASIPLEITHEEPKPQESEPA